MGVLTQHGYDAAHLMGKFQGQKYANDGLPLKTCTDMFVYCEEVRACLLTHYVAYGGSFCILQHSPRSEVEAPAYFDASLLFRRVEEH